METRDRMMRVYTLQFELASRPCPSADAVELLDWFANARGALHKAEEDSLELRVAAQALVNSPVDEQDASDPGQVLEVVEVVERKASLAEQCIRALAGPHATALQGLCDIRSDWASRDFVANGRNVVDTSSERTSLATVTQAVLSASADLEAMIQSHKDKVAEARRAVLASCSSETLLDVEMLHAMAADEVRGLLLALEGQAAGATDPAHGKAQRAASQVRRFVGEDLEEHIGLLQEQPVILMERVKVLIITSLEQVEEATECTIVSILNTQHAYDLEQIKLRKNRATAGASVAESDLERLRSVKRKLDRLGARICAMALRFAQLLPSGDDWLDQLNLVDASHDIAALARTAIWMPHAKADDFQGGEPLPSGGCQISKVVGPDNDPLVLKQFPLTVAARQRRFQRQCVLLQDLDSAHVIRPVSAFIDGPHGYLLTRFYQGGDLAAWIREHDCDGDSDTLDLRRQIACDVVAGIQAVHAAGSVHCDIKPENVFLTGSMRAVLGDFDGAKDISSTITTGSIQSTLRYLAPEYRDGSDAAVAPALDMYSLGVLLRDLFPGEVAGDLIERLTAADPGVRPSAAETLAEIRETANFGLAKHLMRDCSACLESHPPHEVVACEAAHAMCFQCFARWVETGIGGSSGHSTVRVLATGDVQCFERGCEHSWGSKHLAGKLAEDLFMRVALRARELYQAELEANTFQPRLDALFTQRTEEVLAQYHIQRIQDRILTLCCPRCHAAFADFDGCFALKCHACPCHLCGWCLADTGDDSDEAHRHVARCGDKISSDPFFGTRQEFDVAMREVRSRRLSAYWSANVSGLSAAVELRIREGLSSQLGSLVRPDFSL